jgi:hypothetical protein
VHAALGVIKEFALRRVLLNALLALAILFAATFMLWCYITYASFIFGSFSSDPAALGNLLLIALLLVPYVTIATAVSTWALAVKAHLKSRKPVSGEIAWNAVLLVVLPVLFLTFSSATFVNSFSAQLAPISYAALGNFAPYLMSFVLMILVGVIAYLAFKGVAKYSYILAISSLISVLLRISSSDPSGDFTSKSAISSAYIWYLFLFMAPVSLISIGYSAALLFRRTRKNDT